MGGPKSQPRLHKPLLVALLLRYYIDDGVTLVHFADIESAANALIERFVPSASPPRSQYPFWRLREDGFWEVADADLLEVNSSGDPRITDLRSDHPGRWTPHAVSQLHRVGGEYYLELLLDRYFPDRSTSVRDALFEVAASHSLPSTHTRDGHPQAGQAKGSTPVLAVEVTAVTSIPTEALQRERFCFERAATGTAAREEALLTARFESYLASQGRSTGRFRIQAPGIPPLYTDVADMTERVVYEAKSSSDRMSVRLALGQILDYARYLEDWHLAVLLPEPPDDDLISLLMGHDVGCVVETSLGNYRDYTDLKRCQ